MPTLPVGYFSLGMDINLKPGFLLQLKSDFSPWAIVLSTAEPSESQTHPPPDPCSIVDSVTFMAGPSPHFWLFPHLNIQPHHIL